MHLLPEIVAVVTGVVIATGWSRRPKPQAIPIPVRAEDDRRRPRRAE